MFSLRPAKRVLSSALIVALAADGFDCLGMATPEQAMERCKSMLCHSRSEDCCNTMPQIPADFGQPSSVQAIALSPAALGVVQAPSDPQNRGNFSQHYCGTLSRSADLRIPTSPIPPYLVCSPVGCPGFMQWCALKTSIFSGGKR